MGTDFVVAMVDFYKRSLCQKTSGVRRSCVIGRCSEILKRVPSDIASSKGRDVHLIQFPVRALTAKLKRMGVETPLAGVSRFEFSEKVGV